jgi:hypothetical protein
MTVNTPRTPHLAGLSRRQLLAGLVASPVLAALVIACGDPDVERGSSATTVPDTTPPGEIAHSTDPDTAVIRLGYEGGFVPADTFFVNLPTLVISGDRRVYVPGAVPAVFPGPLLLPMGVRSISAAGVQMLLDRAATAGLLGSPPDYTAEMMVADAPDTVVRLTVADGSFEHRAYALGMNIDDQGAATAEATPARRRLFDYVAALGDLATTVGADALGEETLFEPSEYRLRATPVTESDLAGIDPPPTIVDWPAATGLDLATAADCARLSVEAAGTLFTAADQLTVFRQDAVVYRIAVAAVLPGDPAC